MKKDISYFAFPGVRDVVKEGKVNVWELSVKKRRESLEIIRDVICDFYNIKPKDFHSDKRNEDLPRARQLFCYIVRIKMFSHIPLKQVGEFIGINPRTGKPTDHSTVLHGIQKVKDRLDTKEITQVDISSLIEKTQIRFIRLWASHKLQQLKL